jgi:hypothetical protein
MKKFLIRIIFAPYERQMLYWAMHHYIAKGKNIDPEKKRKLLEELQNNFL